MANAPPAVGIDLGTTFSAIAHLDPTGRPVTLVNAEGDLVTPSVVLFESGNIVVGKEALKAISTDALLVAQCAKRDLGARLFDKDLGGRKYPPEAIEAIILAKLKRDAARQIGEFKQCVITVPAYFDEVRRKATQDAGYMAGLEVLDIINEPTAAAVAHGFLKGFLNERGEATHSRRLLVYDLGGGTFDVTVMEIDGGKFTTLATDGDVQLGGYDWDQRLVNHVADEFVRQYGCDPRTEPNTAGRLWRECEDAKRTLSARTKAFVACDFQGHALRVEVTREKFEELTHDLLDRTQFTTRHTLQAAGLGWNDIDTVLLVGGSTRMPMVSRMLKEVSGKEPDGSVAVDEAVAHGAALQAGVLINKAHGQPSAISIRNVNSHSLGVVATDNLTGRKRTAILVPRNTRLPVTAKRVFRTQKEGQQSVLVRIVEGESANPNDCTQIGRCVVRDLPPNLPAQSAINLLFHYEANGRLTVKVSIEGTNKQLQHTINRENSLTPEQLEAWREFVRELH